MNKDKLPQDRMIRMQELIEMIGMQKTTIYYKISRGTFPKPVQLSERAVAWRASDIARWQADLASGVRTENAGSRMRRKGAPLPVEAKDTVQLRLMDALVTLRVFDGVPEMIIENGGDAPIAIKGKDSLQRIGIALIKFC